jgi:hypothetical protein
MIFLRRFDNLTVIPMLALTSPPFHRGDRHDQKNKEP